MTLTYHPDSINNDPLPGEPVEPGSYVVRGVSGTHYGYGLLTIRPSDYTPAPATATPAPTEVPTATPVPTPEPTSTPEPTATSVPTPEPTAGPMNVFKYAKARLDTLDVYDAPNGNVTTQLAKGTYLIVYKAQLVDGATWAYVGLYGANGYLGWVMNDGLTYVSEPTGTPEPTATPTAQPTATPVATPTPSQSPAPALYATVITEYDPLNMRAEPDVNAAIITKVPKGAEVEVIARGENWTHCVYGEYTGYCSTRYLSFNQGRELIPVLEYEGEPELPEDVRAITDILPDETAFDGEYDILVLAYNEPVDMRALPDGEYVTVAGIVQAVQPGENVALREVYTAEPTPERRWILVQTRNGVLGYLPEDLFEKELELVFDSELADPEVIESDMTEQ